MNRTISLSGVDVVVDVSDSVGELRVTENFDTGIFTVSGFDGELCVIFIQTGYAMLVVSSLCQDEIKTLGYYQSPDDYVKLFKQHIESVFGDAALNVK